MKSTSETEARTMRSLGRIPVMEIKPLLANEHQKLPVMTPRQVLDFFAARKQDGKTEPVRVLIELDGFIEMLEAVGGFTLNRRALLTYSSPRVGLIEPPVQAHGKTCYVFPDHFDRMGIILTLRQAYNLPLHAIRDLVERFPRDNYELLMERKLKISDVLDLAKMLKGGYGLADLVMAKAGDVLLMDLLSSSKALSAAAEPGDGLRKLQERLLLARLDEMKVWITSGRWQEFMRAESAQGFKDLAARKALHKRIVAKETVKRARRRAA